MSGEIEEIRDLNGDLRRLGSLMPPKGFVTSFKVWGDSEHPVLDDSQIRRLITDPDRVRRRLLFDLYWILNQRDKGSCNGFAGAAALSKARYLRGWRDKTLLSGAFLYSLINGGRDQGSMLEDGLREVQKTGLPPQDLVPWDQIYPNQQPRNAREEAAKHKGLCAYAVETKQGFRSALALGFPVIVAVHAGRNFMRLNNSGIAGVDNGSGNHAVHCDDICLVNGTEVYDHANSWGPSYGTYGRSYLTWDHFAQTFGNHVFYAISSTEEKE